MRSYKKIAQSLVEYGLILALVAVIAITALRFLGDKVNSAAESAGNQVETTTKNAAQEYCKGLGRGYDETSGACTEAKTGSET